MKSISMNNNSLIKLVCAASSTNDPCYSSLKWLAGLPAETTPEQTWGLCPDATLLFWIAGKIGIDKVLIVLSACDIVETVLHFVPSGEDRPRLAIETVRAWAQGEASLEDVKKAANAAATASHAAYAADAAFRAATSRTAASTAAYAASYAARASTYAAARAAFAAAYVTYAAYDAVDAASYTAAASAANVVSLSRSADLVRVRIPWSLVAERLTTLGIAV